MLHNAPPCKLHQMLTWYSEAHTRGCSLLTRIMIAWSKPNEFFNETHTDDEDQGHWSICTNFHSY